MAVVEEHREIVSAEVHTVYRKVFANEAARLADAGPYKTVELNIKAIQVDTAIEYRLTAISPVTWTAVGAVGGGVQGGAFPSVVIRKTQALPTIGQGLDVNVQLAGLTTDHITANAGFLALSIWLMTEYSTGLNKQEQYTALLRFAAGAGDPDTRLAGVPTELNLLAAAVPDPSVNAQFDDLVGATGEVLMLFEDGLATQGSSDTIVVATVSEYFEQ